MHCLACSRCFCRESGRKRHNVPLRNAQTSATGFTLKEVWKRLDLSPDNPPAVSSPPDAQQVRPQPSGSLQCQVCERWFWRLSDKARHKCTTERTLPVECHHGSVHDPLVCTSPGFTVIRTFRWLYSHLHQWMAVQKHSDCINKVWWQMLTWPWWWNVWI